MHSFDLPIIILKYIPGIIHPRNLRACAEPMRAAARRVEASLVDICIAVWPMNVSAIDESDVD